MCECRTFSFDVTTTVLLIAKLDLGFLLLCSSSAWLLHNTAVGSASYFTTHGIALFLDKKAGSRPSQNLCYLSMGHEPDSNIM